MPSRSLDELDPTFRPLADQLLANIRAAGISVVIISTLRTQAEQDHNVLTGVSQVKVSKHQLGLAIDLCPTDLLRDKGWNPSSALWWEIGEIGIALGLRWGGKWNHPTMPPVGVVPSYFWDPGHFELKTVKPTERLLTA